MLVKSTRRKRIAKLVAGLKTMLASKGKRRNESINSGGFQINGLARIDRSLAKAKRVYWRASASKASILARTQDGLAIAFPFSWEMLSCV
jgi:hypothetical protein